MARQIKAVITDNKKIARDFYKICVESQYLGRKTGPGQFFEVRCSDTLDPLLRRPLGAHRIFKNGIEMLYEVVGKGTDILSRKIPGERLDIIGPLGNGFNLPRNGIKRENTAILIAGGIGVAPMIALAEALRRKKCVTHVLLGAKSKSHILCGQEFKSLGCSVKTATEDGSKGHKGLVTDLLKSLLSTIDHGLLTIYACGPNGMLEAISGIARQGDISCQFSFESHMACGVGVCLGCPVKVRKDSIDFENKMVCKDGPVFKGEDIAW